MHVLARAKDAKKMPGCLVRIAAYFGKDTRKVRLFFAKRPAFPDSLVVSLQDSIRVYKSEGREDK